MQLMPPQNLLTQSSHVTQTTPNVLIEFIESFEFVEFNPITQVAQENRVTEVEIVGNPYNFRFFKKMRNNFPNLLSVYVFS